MNSASPPDFFGGEGGKRFESVPFVDEECRFLLVCGDDMSARDLLYSRAHLLCCAIQGLSERGSHAGHATRLSKHTRTHIYTHIHVQVDSHVVTRE